MNADEIDLSKENIQPLKQGRITAQLGLALKAQNDKVMQEKMLKERESYELAITTYKGDDPLGPRFDYVQWIEQCCPKFGAESNMIPLLEDTIMLFKDDERYKQDSRFVELIIKYIETQDHAPELYQIVHGQGIGTTSAMLYKSWAECLDSCQNLKGADQIYTLGIISNAQPIELLKELHAQFQLSVARRMLIGEDTGPTALPVDNSATVRQRTVLGKLGKTSATGSIRHTRIGPGHVNTLFSDSRNNIKINIYQEEENNVISDSQNNKIGIFANSGEVHKENVMKPHPWNKGFSKKEQSTPLVVPSIPISSTPSFEVLRDDDWADIDDKTKADISNGAPTPATSSKVLKTRKSELTHKTPIQLFKSPHVNSRNNMPKFEVYSGGREFSFEELRLAYYIKHKVENGRTLERKLNVNVSIPSESCNITPLQKLLNIKNPLPLIQESET